MTKKRFVLVSTAFCKKGRPIATRTNNYNKSHSLMAHFAEISGEAKDKIWLHAEVASLIAARDRQVDSILVQRYDVYGNQKLAKPCPTCQAAIKAYGVKTVRYTSEDGIKEEFVKDWV